MFDQWIKYAWLEDERADDDLMGGCLGVAIGLNEAMVRQLFAVDDESRRDATVHKAWQMSASDFGNDASIGEAVVTFEPNGWHGVEHELAVALSRAGRYVAYFWNVNAVMQVRRRGLRSDAARLRSSSLRQRRRRGIGFA
jgi:hypothetical protein